MLVNNCKKGFVNNITKLRNKMAGLLLHVCLTVLLLESIESLVCHQRCLVNEMEVSLQIESANMCHNESMYTVYPNKKACVNVEDGKALKVSIYATAASLTYSGDHDYNIECAGNAENWPSSCTQKPFDPRSNTEIPGSCHLRCVDNKMEDLPGFYIESSFMCWHGNIAPDKYWVKENTKKCVYVADGQGIVFSTWHTSTPYPHFLVGIWYGVNSNIQCTGKTWPPFCTNLPFDSRGHVDGILF